MQQYSYSFHIISCYSLIPDSLFVNPDTCNEIIESSVINFMMCMCGLWRKPLSEGFISSN